MNYIFCRITFTVSLNYWLLHALLPVSLSLCLSKAQIVLSFSPCWPQWGVGVGLAGRLPPDSLWRWRFYQPHAGRLFLLTNKSISHANYTALYYSWLPTLGLTLCSLYFNKCICQTNPGSMRFWIPKDHWLFSPLYFSGFLCPSFSLQTNPLCPRTRSVHLPAWIIHRVLSMTLKGAPSLLCPEWWWNALLERSVFLPYQSALDR